MKLRDSVTIDAAPDEVWLFVADPIMQSLWNDKIVSLDRDLDGPVLPGEQYTMLYRMSSKASQSRVDVSICQPPQRVDFNHQMVGPGGQIVEAYELEAHGDGCRVVQTIDLTHSGIPRLLHWLVWLIWRFGKPKEEPMLHKLKRLVEEGESSRA